MPASIPWKAGSAPIWNSRVAERTAELLEREAALRAEVAERRRAEEALAQQAALLKEQADLLNLSQDAIVAHDMGAHIRFWNRGATERYGWSASEVMGLRSHTLLQTIFPYPIEQVYADLLAHDRWEGELVHTRRYGSRIVVASRWALQRDADGQPIGVLEINNDITDQKEAQAQLAYQAQLLGNVSDAVMATDTLGTIKAWNHAAEELFRLSADDALGRQMMELFRPDFTAPDEQHAMAMLAATGRYRGEINYHRLDGSIIYAETTGVALHDEVGRVTGYIAVTTGTSANTNGSNESCGGRPNGCRSCMTLTAPCWPASRRRRLQAPRSAASASWRRAIARPWCCSIMTATRPNGWPLTAPCRHN